MLSALYECYTANDILSCCIIYFKQYITWTIKMLYKCYGGNMNSLSLTALKSLTRTYSGLSHHSPPSPVIKVPGWQLAVISCSGDSVALLWAWLHQHLWMTGWTICLLNWTTELLKCIGHSGSCLCSMSHLGNFSSFFFVLVNSNTPTSQKLL